MDFFKRWNTIAGWSVFAASAIVYLLTMEPSSSLWDCSEFIATSYKLEVGHPPGAPLFMMLARLATMLAPSTHYVPHMVNAMNCIASAFCILFLFWTITHLARRIYTKDNRRLNRTNSLTVIGAGIIGAMAYTFTDSFWFSAVEGEVYALSSMFTALVVWLMLKWEEQADQPHSMRWIILIAYLMGLSIGVHILNLLTVPALVFIYYFRRTEKVTFKGIALTTLSSLVILWFINGIIIPYTVYIGAMVDLLFVNSFGLPVNSGIVLFALLLFVVMGFAIYYTHKKGHPVINGILVAVTMILIGYSSYASVTIRAAANPPMNSNNPNNPHALLSLLNRDQYGDKPLLYGAYYSAPPVGYKEKTVYYIDEDGKYKDASIITGYIHSPEFMHVFPRMWDAHKGEKEYKQWGGYRTKIEVIKDENGEVVRDQSGKAVTGPVIDFGQKVTIETEDGPITIVEPTFGENLKYFFDYQLSYMYWRYFLWNFVGRQSDIQPMGNTILDGNWLSGIKWIDEAYLGPQTNLPDEVANNKGRNTYFFLPFILGLIGLIYQLNRDQRNFTVVMWLFIMMGVALVVYFNSSPGEPRERDYVYAGSFYAFCIWIGFGVMAVRDMISAVIRRKGASTAIAATVICAAVPGILAAQNWDDHDRSYRTMARDIGWNYLQSTLPNSIIINYGDNDTFPLWFNQEVDGVRTDVRIMNTSYLGGEWYIDEMKTKANEAPGIPFTLPKSKYTYVNDVIPVVSYIDRPLDAKDVIYLINSEDERTKVRLPDGSLSDCIPTTMIAIPVNKENAIASGIVKEQDRDLIVDTVYMKIKGRSVDKSTMMLIDMFAHFDWKRPIYFTQAYMLNNLGLLNYLQFDGYAYRFVPILTPYDPRSWDVGRVDPDYAAPLLLETFRYGNVDNPKVYVDNFIQYNISASRTRDSFARVAKEYIKRGDTAKAIELLDAGLAKMPTSQIRFSETNTYPFIESYYAAGAMEKGDSLLIEYADNLMQYIDYYLSFDGAKGDMVSGVIGDKFNMLDTLYNLAAYAGRKDVIAVLNKYYRKLGIPEEQLTNVGDAVQIDSTQQNLQ